MTIISLVDIAHNYSFGETSLFEKVRFDISRGDRMGLIGPNGCGKTTLLRIIAGELKPISGTMVRPKEQIEQGYLRQEAKESFAGSLFEYVFSVFAEAFEAKTARDALEEEIGKSESVSPDLGLRYSARNSSGCTSCGPPRVARRAWLRTSRWTK